MFFMCSPTKKLMSDYVFSKLFNLYLKHLSVLSKTSKISRWSRQVIHPVGTRTRIYIRSGCLRTIDINLSYHSDNCRWYKTDTNSPNAVVIISKCHRFLILWWWAVGYNKDTLYVEKLFFCSYVIIIFIFVLQMTVLITWKKDCIISRTK